MKRNVRYLILFCCTALLIIFLGQIDGYTVAQNSSVNNDVVDALAFTPDGKTLAISTEDGQIILTDPETGIVKETLPESTNSPITDIAFSSDGETLFSVGKDTQLRQWQVKTGKKLPILEAQEHPIRAVAVSPDNKFLAAAGEDPKIALWNADTNKLDKILQGHKCFVNSVVFSPKGNLLASADNCGLIKVWDINTGKQLQSLLGHSGAVNAVAFNQDGTILASASDDTTVRLWDLATFKKIRVLNGATNKFTTVAFSKNGKRIFATAGNEILRWDVATGDLLARLKSNNAAIKKLVISRDGFKFATANKNGDINVGDAEKSLVRRSFRVNRKFGKNKNLKAVKSQINPSKEVAFRSTGKTLMAAIPAAPGGPILLITSTANPFSTYYTEILRNEGLNSFNVSDISSVSAATLANYDVVVLADVTLTAAQVTTFSNWVTGGGNLIAMHPDKQLATLLGLTDAGTTLTDAYLLVDNSTDIGNGIVEQTIQFHGSADRYNLNGAASIATLYTNATTATSNPAVTLRNVGNGKAAAFTYDLARSVILTRQGNPAWAGQERDSFAPIRSDDLYFGNKSGDVKPDWIDLNKVAIPQADEQQRLLANMIIKMNLAKKPLPRFWYFPNGKKAVVLMTGDDHANGGTKPRFEQFKQLSPAGCSVDNWECVRGTSYIYPTSQEATYVTNAEAAAYTADGFDIELHVNTNCVDFTPTSLQTFYTQQLNQFATNYPSIPAPSTQRHHCLVWSDWFTTPQVELNNGIRLDTTYYYWPPSWIADRPGFFTGSGMPMRFANTNGTMIDVYGAATQLTDESGQTYPYNIDTLLDKAIGPEGYYGVFNVNAHTDYAISTESDAVVASAQQRGVPVVSGRQVLKWLDGRNSSSFGSLAWSNNSLSFNITKGADTTGLQAMLPNRFANLTLSSITRNGSPVTYTPQTIKGIEYAFFPGNAGSYIATYTGDTTPPTVSSTSPSIGATSVNTVTSVTATFSEAIDPTTINSNTFELRTSTNTVVAATVTYDSASKTATLTPNSSLALSTSYTAIIKGGTTDPRVKDLAGNALAANFTWSFTTTATVPPQSVWNNSTTPTNPSANDPNAVELGVKFRSNVNGFITGIRFYKGNTINGTYTGNLWTINGQNLGTATITQSASGWQQINFSSPVAITANTVYVASYHTSIGRYAINQNFFANSGVSNSALYLLSNSEAGGNGVYNYGSASSFPNNTYQSSNYWVDVLFTTSIGPDTTPPTVISRTPNNGATGVSIGTSVTATFSEAINSATINNNTFQLRDANNTLIPATISYNSANNTATLTPTSPLAASTFYTATILGGTTGVKDLGGNALGANAIWSFTTGTAFSTIWTGETPAVLADSDTNAVELGVKFQSNVSGVITGIRFYKSTSNTGTHIGSLWTSGGTLLATATFSNETASGWQQVNFSTPVAITANTTYVASYHTNVGRYSVDNNYFATADKVNGPLRALSNGTSGGNGVYRYSSVTPVFPNFTYNSSNYWVDVVFTRN